MAPQCSGEAQSPVDIAEYTLASNRWEDNLMINFYKEGGLITGTLVNNGKAPTLEVDKTGRSAARLTGVLSGTVCICWSNSIFTLDVRLR